MNSLAQRGLQDCGMAVLRGLRNGFHWWRVLRGLKEFLSSFCYSLCHTECCFDTSYYKSTITFPLWRSSSDAVGPNGCLFPDSFYSLTLVLVDVRGLSRSLKEGFGCCLLSPNLGLGTVKWCHRVPCLGDPQRRRRGVRLAGASALKF